MQARLALRPEHRASTAVVALVVCQLLAAQRVDASALVIESVPGGPGDTNIAVAVHLDNDVAYYGVQLRLLYDEQALSLTGVQPGGRTAAFSEFSYREYSPGQAAVIMYDESAAALPSGAGEIFSVIFDVLVTAGSGNGSVAIVDVVAVDIEMQYDEVFVENGGIVATAVYGVRGESREFGVLIGWFAHGGYTKFHVERAADAGYNEWSRISISVIDAETADESYQYVYRDRDVEPGKVYRYRIVGLDDRGVEAVLWELSVDYDGARPLRLGIGNNYPNPFNPSTKFKVAIPRSQSIKLRIYDLSGRFVTELYSGDIGPGYHEFTWLGRDSSDRGVAAGVYFCRLEAQEFVKSIKVMLLK